jgi:transglutaminase-like putative cysteine protease
MTGRGLRLPGTFTVSLLAGLTTWVSLLTWTGFSERPSGFLVPLFFACLLVAVVGMLLRSAHLHPLLVAPVQAAALLLWLNHLWAGDVSLAGWLPTGTSLNQVAVNLGHSMSVSQHYAAPVPKDVVAFYPAVILAGCATAVLVDLLACGLRRVPLAGLPLLAVYTAPLSILAGGVSWVKFAIGALCFLFLIAADETRRLTHWGRQLTSGLVQDSQVSTVSGQAVRASARKIGLTATGLAVVVPLLVPTLGAGLLAKSGNGPGDGNGAVSLSNPMVSLKRDLVQGQDENLVYVTTPDPDPSYLRIAVLDQFDGSAWRPSGRAIPVQQRSEGQMPPPPGLDPDVPRTEVPYSIRITPQFRSRWLPTPYPIASIKATGDWRYDTTTMDFISAADGQTTAGMHYRLRALHPSYNSRRLNNVGPPPVDLMAKYTKLPKDLPPSVQRLARQVTSRQTTDFSRAVRLQDWFRGDGGFTYSLAHASGDSMQQLARFLGHGPDSRTGYCQQFAGAMALMGRTLGIPSRVAVGFYQPQYVSGDTWVFSSHDLHAWPEMYFDGVGWVRFEPTPSPRVAGVPAYTVGPLSTVDPFHPQPTTPLPTGQNRFDQKPGVKTGVTSTQPTGHHAAGWNGPLTAVLVLLGVLLLASLPRLVRGWLRRRRWGTARTAPALAEAAWAELRDVALDLRLGWDDTVTPRVRARDLATAFGSPDDADFATSGQRSRGRRAAPKAAAALDRLVELVERARYARPGAREPVDEAVTRQVFEDVAVCARALRDGTTRGRRLVAGWAPVSLVVGGRRKRGASEGLRTFGLDHAT